MRRSLPIREARITAPIVAENGRPGVTNSYPGLMSAFVYGLVQCDPADGYDRLQGK